MQGTIHDCVTQERNEYQILEDINTKSGFTFLSFHCLNQQFSISNVCLKDDIENITQQRHLAY